MSEEAPDINGFEFVLTLRELRSLKAEAWDEGFTHLFDIQRHGGGASLHDNPYRCDTPDDAPTCSFCMEPRDDLSIGSDGVTTACQDCASEGEVRDV